MTGNSGGSKQTGPASVLGGARFIPVITIERRDDGVPLARALIAGGVNVVEITLRTTEAIHAAEQIAREVPEAILGIGTLRTAQDLAHARSAGAHFALSAGATPELLDAAAADGMPFVPGIATASELLAAVVRGFNVVKLFPAVQVGGIPTLKALAGPFPDVKFCPTGGISEDNINDWLAQPNVLAAGGSWVVPPDEIRDGNWDKITERARRVIARIGEAAGK